MTERKAFDYLKSLPKQFLPKSVIKGIREVSNAELKRWLNDKAVIINGETPAANDSISFPVEELVFFPAGKRKTTLVKEEHG